MIVQEPIRITRLMARNFRSIGALDLKLRPLTIVLGPNGSGKSSLLDIPVLLQAARDGQLQRYFAKFGGFDATARYEAGLPAIQVGISTEADGQAVDYDLELLGERGGFAVASEKLTVHSGPGGGNGVTVYERNDTNVSINSDRGPTSGQVPHGPELNVFAHGTHDYLPAAEGLIESLKRIHHFQSSRFQLPEVRRSQPMQPTSFPPQTEGADLFSVLYELRENDHARYSDIVETMRIAVPEFDGFDFPVAGRGNIDLAWRLKDVSKKLYPIQLSDGTLRFLWLITILATAPDGCLLLIDEPDFSLHPQWLLLLVSMMRVASARATLIVATQSAEFVRWLEPSELVVADLTEEGAAFHWADQHPDIDDWLKDFTLSELWTMGELGGRR